ncbi:hypothetical protein [Flavobacterium sp. 3-210]
MFNILDVLSQHKVFLENNLKELKIEQRKKIAVGFAQFYFLLDNVSECVEKHLKIKITEEELINNLKNNNIQYFKDALEKYDSETDEYADEFVELDAMEINILSGLENCVFSIENSQNVLLNFLLLIDILDYYENFSDNPEYWNKLLKEEIFFQKEIVQQIKNEKSLNDNFYFDRYKDVLFDQI